MDAVRTTHRGESTVVRQTQGLPEVRFETGLERAVRAARRPDHRVWQMDGAGQQDQGQGLSLASVVGRKQPFGTFIMETKTALDSEVPIPAFLNTGTTRLSSKLTANLAEKMSNACTFGKPKLWLCGRGLRHASSGHAVGMGNLPEAWQNQHTSDAIQTSPARPDPRCVCRRQRDGARPAIRQRR